MKRFIVCIRVKKKILDIEALSRSAEAAERRARVAIMFSRHLDPEDIHVLGVHEEREIEAEEVRLITGNFPHPSLGVVWMSHLNIEERMVLSGANSGR